MTADLSEVRALLKIGAKTRWGKVAAIGIINGERYYWLVSGSNVAMMPAVAVEEECDADD